MTNSIHFTNKLSQAISLVLCLFVFIQIGTAQNSTEVNDLFSTSLNRSSRESFKKHFRDFEVLNINERVATQIVADKNTNLNLALPTTQGSVALELEENSILPTNFKVYNSQDDQVDLDLNF